MNIFTVYKHTSPSGMSYIGLTRQYPPHKRWGNGINNYHHNKIFVDSIKFYGWENFTHEILWQGQNEEEAKLKERFYIEYYDSRRNGYNITFGGETCTEETCKKINETKFKNNTFLKVSEESKMRWQNDFFREKTINAMKGKRNLTKEQIEHYRKVALNRKYSDETRKKLSEKSKNRIGENSPRSKCVLKIDANTNEIIEKYISAREASIKNSLCITQVASICRRENKYFNGYFWIYEKDFLRKEVM